MKLIRGLNLEHCDRCHIYPVFKVAIEKIRNYFFFKDMSITVQKYCLVLLWLNEIASKIIENEKYFFGNFHC